MESSCLLPHEQHYWIDISPILIGILDNGIAMDGFQGDPYDDLNEDGKRNGNEPFLDIHKFNLIDFASK